MRSGLHAHDCWPACPDPVARRDLSPFVQGIASRGILSRQAVHQLMSLEHQFGEADAHDRYTVDTIGIPAQRLWAQAVLPSCRRPPKALITLTAYSG